MRRALLPALLRLVLLAAPASAAPTPFPIDCKALDVFWSGIPELNMNGKPLLPGIHDLLIDEARGQWPLRHLRCDLVDKGRFTELQDHELRDMAVARAGFILGLAERWARSAPPFDSPVAEGSVGGAPPNMLLMVSRNSTGLEFDPARSGGAARYPDGRIHLAADNFSVSALRDGIDGISLALQLVHEAQHAHGGHVQCWDEKPEAGLNCDSNVLEQFTQLEDREKAGEGGSHGVASQYAAWIANYSTWPLSYRRAARDTALMIMGCSPPDAKGKRNCMKRINDRAAADRWTCRYFGVHSDDGTPCEAAAKRKGA